MNIKVLYFARLREDFRLGAENLSLPDSANVDCLLDLLRQRGGIWMESLAPERAFRVAVNQDIATGDTLLTEAAEVAIFPPVTGG